LEYGDYPYAPLLEVVEKTSKNPHTVTVQWLQYEKGWRASELARWSSEFL